jgi:membrane-associated phospholipid phosphatase
MVIIVVTLTIIVDLYIGDLAINAFNPVRWLGICVIVCIFLIVSFLLDVIVSCTELKNFTDPLSGNVNVSDLWKKVFTNPVNGLILMVIVLFGITSAQSLSEYYRVNVTTWHDATLWTLEENIFFLLKGSLIDIPKFWDRIYLICWPNLLLAFCVLYRKRRFNDLGIMSIATVLCYFLTRWIAIQYPTAGPIFYKPEFFDLSGTHSAAFQEMLIRYMQGNEPQAGFIPGTMGMPSLHVGISALGAWFLARHVKWTIWPSILWVCLTWISTVMLGWHYALDGIGGIAVVVVAIMIARTTLTIMNCRSGKLPPHRIGARFDLKRK